MSELPRLAKEAHYLYGPTILSFRETLPDPSMFPSIEKVYLMKEDLKMFRDRYAILNEFVGKVIGKKEFSLLDIIDYYYKRSKP